LRLAADWKVRAPFSKTIPERCFRSVKSTHPVHSPTRRGRGGTKVQARHRRAIRCGTEHGTGDQLPQVRQTAIDVTSHQIGILLLHFETVARVPRQDAIPKTWSKPFDLL